MDLRVLPQIHEVREDVQTSPGQSPQFRTFVSHRVIPAFLFESVNDGFMCETEDC